MFPGSYLLLSIESILVCRWSTVWYVSKHSRQRFTLQALQWHTQTRAPGGIVFVFFSPFPFLLLNFSECAHRWSWQTWYSFFPGGGTGMWTNVLSSLILSLPLLGERALILNLGALMNFFGVLGADFTGDFLFGQSVCGLRSAYPTFSLKSWWL